LLVERRELYAIKDAVALTKRPVVKGIANHMVDPGGAPLNDGCLDSQDWSAPDCTGDRSLKPRVAMSIDWTSIFYPSLGLAEVVVRGSIMYLALFAILRFVGRRQSGHFGPADLLVIVLIADAAQNALGKDYQSVTEGVVLVFTIVAWEYALDWAAWKFPRLRPLLKAPPLLIVKDGRLIKPAMRREMISEEELMGQLREQEIEDLAEVRTARIEGDGRLSVLKKRLRASEGE
jgi:hypothetical protein